MAIQSICWTKYDAAALQKSGLKIRGKAMIKCRREFNGDACGIEDLIATRAVGKMEVCRMLKAKPKNRSR